MYRTETTLKRFLLTALAACLTVTGLPALSRTHEAHERLYDEIRALGINLKLNPTECMQKPGVMGWYASLRNEMVICQEYGVANGVQVNWSREDYDTLRHEAQHLIQDCMDRSQNARLQPVYQDPIGLAKNTLSGSTIGWILNEGYGDQPPIVQVLELEAFAVAEMNDPIEQVRDIRKYCY